MWLCSMEVPVGSVYECRVEVEFKGTCGWTMFGREEYMCNSCDLTFPLPSLPSFVSSTTGEAETKKDG